MNSTTLEVPVGIRPNLIEQLSTTRGVIRKVDYPTIASAVLAALLEECSSLETYVRLRNIADIVEEALCRVKEPALAQLNGGSALVLGAVVQRKALPRKWEYDDGVLRGLESDKSAIDSRIRTRKKFLESLREEHVDISTGEVVRPARLVAEGETLQVTF